MACWVSWGRTDGGDAGRMLWRDCEIAQVLPGGAFRARCFSSAGEPRVSKPTGGGFLEPTRLFTGDRLHAAMLVLHC